MLHHERHQTNLTAEGRIKIIYADANLGLPEVWDGFSKTVADNTGVAMWLMRGLDAEHGKAAPVTIFQYATSDPEIQAEIDQWIETHDDGYFTVGEFDVVPGSSQKFQVLLIHDGRLDLMFKMAFGSKLA